MNIALYERFITKAFENDLTWSIHSQLKIFDTLKSKSSENFEELILPVEKASIILKTKLKRYNAMFLKINKIKKLELKWEKNVSMQ